MPSSDSRQALGVLGMHRSGTSLVARVLNLLGVDLGPEEDLLEPRFDNPRGYWEQRPIMEINEAILEALGGSWSRPPEMPAGWTERPDIEAIATRAREVVVSQFGESELWAWKDPRLSLTLPFWRAIVPDARWIVCLRSPVDVAASLLRRDPTELTWDAAVDLWLRHSAEALEQTAEDERLILFYEDWFVDGEAQLSRLMSFLGRDVASASPSVREDVDAYIETDLRHHRSTALEVAQLAGLSSEARAFYLSLRAANVVSTVTATGRADLATSMEPGLSDALERVAPNLRHAGAARLALAEARRERDEAVTAAESERDEGVRAAESERDEAVAAGRRERDHAVRAAESERDEAVAEARREREHAVRAAESERDEAVAAVNQERDSVRATAQEREAGLDRAHRELDQTRRRLEDAQRTASDRERELVRVKAQLNKERMAVRALRESTSWRVTRPLRSGKHTLTLLKAGKRLLREPESGELRRPEPEATQKTPQPGPAAHADRSRAPAPKPSSAPAPPSPRRVLRSRRPTKARQRSLAATRVLFDSTHYSAQAGVEFSSVDEALDHYLETGYREGFDPHPLFDGQWYARRHPEVAAPRENPLLAFVEEGVAGGHDPNPYFDTDFYYSQLPGLRQRGENALCHYVENASANKAANPNPLFGNGFYLGNHPVAAATPLEHFLSTGWRERRATSAVHRNILTELRKASSALWRGRWRSNRVLLFTDGDSAEAQPNLFALADRLSADHHLGSMVVALRWGTTGAQRQARALVLEDFERSCPGIFRPSALRLLTCSVAALRPALAIADLPEVVETLRASGVGTYFVLPEAEQVPETRALDEAVDHARRMLVPSSEAFHAVQRTLGRYPTNVALRPPPHKDANGSAPAQSSHGETSSVEEYVESLVRFAARDFGLDTRTDVVESRSNEGLVRKVFVPCSDWAVSGVNASLEALGRELTELGWEVEVVFTRDESFVLETAGGEANMPKLPYRYLSRDEAGIMGMWEALVADLEGRAPCILFLAYDFLSNSVTPALTDKVGIVAWAQSDDGDYYEQVYRLGRYCNAVVCVSERIGEEAVALNPAIGERTHVIHNSSVWETEIVESRPERGSVMRLVYTGRLVQYQKRVLEFVELAGALERTGVPFEIALVGTFPRQEEKTKRAFEELARPYLEDGRISLLGRKPRDELLAELTRHDFFVLLSDFEGLPLSLVEAMARGCVPVVSDSRSGVPEVVASGDNGFLVGGRDYDAWAKLLVETWQDRETLARMSERARATVREAFTVEQAARRFDALFRSVSEEIEAGYCRPDSLHWGEDRSGTGDVLPPPNLHRPNLVQVAGLR